MRGYGILGWPGMMEIGRHGLRCVLEDDRATRHTQTVSTEHPRAAVLFSLCCWCFQQWKEQIEYWLMKVWDSEWMTSYNGISSWDSINKGQRELLNYRFFVNFHNWLGGFSLLTINMASWTWDHMSKNWISHYSFSQINSWGNFTKIREWNKNSFPKNVSSDNFILIL